MFPSSIRQKIRSGGPVICAKTSYNHPEVAELIGAFGFDALWICLEHKRVDPSVVTALLQACRIHRIDPIVRVKPSNYADVLWLIESGARGIMLPRVRNIAEVRDAVDAMKYPPLGRRGYDGVGPEADFGLTPRDTYFADANAQNLLVVQIEEPEVIPHIDVIAATPGVDILFIGPADLTLGLGRFGKVDDPEIQSIIRQVGESCRRHGKIAGIPCTVEQIPSYRALGYGFFNVISDFKCVRSGLESVSATLTRQGIPLSPRILSGS
jgi:4-hydroxy-2-oxoheptanedioate aldolase